MNVLAELRKRAPANPAKVANRRPATAGNSQDSQDSQGVTPENAARPAVAMDSQDSQDSQRVAAEPTTRPPALPTDLRATRAAMLETGDRLGLDPAIVHRIPAGDLALWAMVPADALRAYLLAMADTATRLAGKVPPGDTAAIHCAGCGVVYVHPDVAAVLPVVDGWPRALGCPWCAIRKAGGYVPRPPIQSGTCAHWKPDHVNPAAGMGTCACGTFHPMQPHACGQYQPQGVGHD